MNRFLKRFATAVNPSGPDTGADAPARAAHDLRSPDVAAKQLAAHVAAPGGMRAAELLEAAGTHRARLGLDGELRDADGVPVMRARIDDLQPDVLLDELEPVLVALHARRLGRTADPPRDHVMRALTALAGPLAGTARSLQPWTARLDDAGKAPPMLHWLLGWPADWTDFEREAATGWASRRLARQTGLPATRMSLTPHAASSGEELWRHAEARLQALVGFGRGDRLLVTACHSDLSASAITALERDQRLFSASHRPRGLIPGEAAAALLLADPAEPDDPAADHPPPRLHRAVPMRRSTSIDAAGRVSSDNLQACARQALEGARLDPAEVVALVADGDQHTPRGAELHGAALALLPHLDAADDLRLIGIANGHTGIANTLLVIAAAAERARADAGPCLGLCVGDPFMRLALVAR